jgi:hypothetical protein
VKPRSNRREALPAHPAHRPAPGGGARHTTVSRRSRHSTVRAAGANKPPKPRPRAAIPKPTLRAPKPGAPKRQVARILDDDSTLIDLIDNLLSKGVMLNADLILALANVDLVYIRVAALLCAADRVRGVRPGFVRAMAEGQGGGQAPSRK